MGSGQLEDLRRVGVGLIGSRLDRHVLGSWLGRLHPLTKLAVALPVVVGVYLLPWLWLPPLLLAGVLALAQSGGAAGRLLRQLLLLIWPIVLSLVLIQGLLFPPVGATPLPLGPLHVTVEGVTFAALISGRLAVLTATMLLVLQSTHPADLVLALTQLGLPRGAGYVLLVALQLVPDMRARAAAILEAQQARGLELAGWRRASALLPLLGPLVIGALADVEERAMAIESRAYLAPGPKTQLRQLHDTAVQRWVRGLGLLAVLAVLVGWVWLGR